MNYFCNWIYQKMFLTKVGVLNWYSSKWLRNLQFCNSISFVRKSPRKFWMQFLWFHHFIVISFHRIPLTWWNAYLCFSSLDRWKSALARCLGSCSRNISDIISKTWKQYNVSSLEDAINRSKSSIPDLCNTHKIWSWIVA